VYNFSGNRSHASKLKFQRGMSLSCAVRVDETGWSLSRQMPLTAKGASLKGFAIFFLYIERLGIYVRHTFFSWIRLQLMCLRTCSIVVEDSKPHLLCLGSDFSGSEFLGLG
jgi:hypothetical protein